MCYFLSVCFCIPVFVNNYRIEENKQTNLKGACGCVNTNTYKKCLSNIFKLFFKKPSFKTSHLNTTKE